MMVFVWKCLLRIYEVKEKDMILFLKKKFIERTSIYPYLSICSTYWILTILNAKQLSFIISTNKMELSFCFWERIENLGPIQNEKAGERVTIYWRNLSSFRILAWGFMKEKRSLDCVDNLLFLNNLRMAKMQGLWCSISSMIFPFYMILSYLKLRK